MQLKDNKDCDYKHSLLNIKRVNWSLWFARYYEFDSCGLFFLGFVLVVSDCYGSNPPTPKYN